MSETLSVPSALSFGEGPLRITCKGKPQTEHTGSIISGIGTDGTDVVGVSSIGIISSDILHTSCL